MADKKIIFADDNDGMRSLAELNFEINFSDYGFEIYEDGDQLEERLNESLDGVELIVTDENMPGPNGSEIIAKYARKPGYENIPFILHYADAESIGKRAIENGAAGYVLKGNINDLVVKMREVLGE